MTTIRRIYAIHLLVATAALAGGFALQNLWPVALGVVLVCGLWLLAHLRGVSGLEGLALFVFFLADGVGVYLGLPGWLGLLAAVACLGAWDLDHFIQRLRSVERVAFESGLGHEHLRRLGLVELVAFVTGLLALIARARIPFWWEILLVILLALGLGQIIGFVRKQAGD